MIVTLSASATIFTLVAAYLATLGLAKSANLAISAGAFDERSAKFANA